MDRGAWGATVYGVTKSQTRLATELAHTTANYVDAPTPLGNSNFKPFLKKKKVFLYSPETRIL